MIDHNNNTKNLLLNSRYSNGSGLFFESEDSLDDDPLSKHLSGYLKND